MNYSYLITWKVSERYYYFKKIKERWEEYNSGGSETDFEPKRQVANVTRGHFNVGCRSAFTWAKSQNSPTPAIVTITTAPAPTPL